MIPKTAITSRHAALQEYLFGLELFGIKLGLDNITTMMHASGDPHLACPVVHVAGTNGKGSVIAFLDAMFSKAGYKTGRFTSPHLIEVNERFLIGCQPISDDALDVHIAYYRDLCDTEMLSPTFFELTTAIAFRHFAQEKVDIALIEVGMGGRLDSTNVVSPTLCVITNIDYDHTEHLGDTMAKIAWEKAGIIKAGVPVICGEMHAEAMAVIKARAEELDAELLRTKCGTGAPAGHLRIKMQTGGDAGPTLANVFEKVEVRLGLLGEHQLQNAAIAQKCAELLQAQFPKITAEKITQGLQTAHWPCRMEKVMDDPPVIIDVAHNPAGARQISKSLSHCVCVLSVSGDKDAAEMIAALAPCVGLFIFTQNANKRAMPTAQLAGYASDVKYECRDTLGEAVEYGISLATEDCPLLITGSIFTAGEAYAYLIETHGIAPLRF